jgi:hypothetical protein
MGSVRLTSRSHAWFSVLSNSLCVSQNRTAGLDPAALLLIRRRSLGSSCTRREALIVEIIHVLNKAHGLTQNFGQVLLGERRVSERQKRHHCPNVNWWSHHRRELTAPRLRGMNQRVHEACLLVISFLSHVVETAREKNEIGTKVLTVGLDSKRRMFLLDPSNSAAL